MRGFEDSPEKERPQRAKQQQQPPQQSDKSKKEVTAAKKEPQMQQGQCLSCVEEGVAII